MSDICQHCAHLGDFKACEQEDCYIHDGWYVMELRLKLRAAQGKIQDLNDELLCCAGNEDAPAASDQPNSHKIKYATGLPEHVYCGPDTTDVCGDT